MSTFTYTQAIGGVICRARRLHGASQTEFAQKLGVSQSGYSKLERGQTVLSVVQLRRLADHLGTTPADLLARADLVVQQARQQGHHIELSPPPTNSAATLLGLAAITALVLVALGD